MEYKLDKNFSLTTDEHNFTLNKIRVKGEESENAGEEYYSAIGYYGTLEMCLKGYLKHSLRKDSDGVKNVNMLLNKLEEVNKNIEMFCSEFKENNMNKGK